MWVGFLNNMWVGPLNNIWVGPLKPGTNMEEKAWKVLTFIDLLLIGHPLKGLVPNLRKGWKRVK